MNLCLLQIADSALPISGYTHSWGLEGAIARRLVHDAESLERWTGQWLRTSLGPLEGVLVASACRARPRGKSGRSCWRLNGLAEVSIIPPSIRCASREMGAQLICARRDLGLVRRRAGAVHAGTRSSEPRRLAPLGRVRAARGTRRRRARRRADAYLHQAALGMIGAGVRAIPVGHTHGQQVLAYLHDEIRNLAQDLVGREAETAGAGCPFYEVLCDEQTRLYARMFRS